MPCLETDHLSRSFGANTAVDDLNITLDDGEIYGLTGPDGAGKTTTSRLLAGVLEPTDGTATILGRDLVAERESLKRDVSYLPSQFALYEDLTILENLQFVGEMYGVDRSTREQRIEDLLSLCRLTPFADRRAGDLSGGMKQKLTLSCGLLPQPDLLIMDEPTRGIDPVSRQELWEIFHRRNRDGITMFVATSSLPEARKCDRVGLLLDGRLLKSGPPGHLEREFGYTLLNVELEQPRKWIANLRSELAPRPVYLFGQHLHVVCESPDNVSDTIRQFAEERDLDPPVIERIEATLEDVFMTLLSDEEEASTGSIAAGGTP